VPLTVEAQNALESTASSTVIRCTSGSANSAFTATHNRTFSPTAAAPIPSSVGPMIRATANDETSDSTAPPQASRAVQKILVFTIGVAPYQRS